VFGTWTAGMVRALATFYPKTHPPNYHTSTHPSFTFILVKTDIFPKYPKKQDQN
jgi:hypothetical protein